MPAPDLRFSKFLSYVLHPLIIPTFATAALLMRQDAYSIVLPFYLKIWYLSVVFAFTWLIPVAAVFVLLRFKAIYSVEMSRRSERTIPLLIASASYMALMFFVRPVNIPPLFLYVVYSATFALLAGLLINMVYKISLHTLGWGAVTATLISISLRLGLPMLTLISVSILLSGLAGYARLKENAHNQTQVYVGYIAGAAIVMLIIFLV